MKQLLFAAVLTVASAAWADVLPPPSAESAPAAVRAASSSKKKKKRKGLSCAAVPGAPLALGLVLVAGLARRKQSSP